MITLINQPGPINLLADEIKLGFYADGRLQSAGAKASANVSVAGSTMATGTTLTFAWNGITEVISFVSSPDESGNQCVLLNPGNASVFINHLYECLQANYNLAQDFNITKGASNVAIQAYEQGAKSLAVTKSSGTTGLTISSVNQGTDPVYRENYGIIVQTYASGYNGVMKKLAEDRLTPDSTGYAEADFGELLNDQTDPVFNWPANQAVTARVGMTTRFYFKYCEVWDNDPQKLYKTTEYAGIWGGLPRAAHAALDNNMADWWQYFKANKRFLTNQPAYVPTTTQSPQRLYWLCMESGLSSVNIKVKSWNLGGIDNVVMATISSPVQYRVYEIDTSYQRMMLNNWASPNDLRYEVSVTKTDGTVLAGPQGYTIDRKPAKNIRHFMFRNSLGGFDTLIARGVLTQGIEINRYVAEYNSEGEREAWLNEAEYVNTQNAGHLPAGYKKFLAELLLSQEVWLVNDDYTRQRILLTNTQDTLATDNEKRPTFSFEYVSVTKDQFYTNHF